MLGCLRAVGARRPLEATRLAGLVHPAVLHWGTNAQCFVGGSPLLRHVWGESSMPDKVASDRFYDSTVERVSYYFSPVTVYPTCS
jgi:hypothetical protein